MAALNDLATSDEAVRQILEDRSIGHSKAAHLICTNYDDATTERSVRRWRKKHSLSLDGMTSPYADSARLAERPKRDAPVPVWTPGIEYDPQVGGEFRTVPREVIGQQVGFTEPDPDEAAILGEFGLDATVWEITGARKSKWQQRTADGEERWLTAQRVSFRKKSNTSRLIAEDVERVLLSYPAPAPVPVGVAADKIIMVPAGDLQLGKQDGGGTAATIERFARITDSIAHELDAQLGVKALVLPWLGDCIEGIVSQNSTMLTRLDISVTEQVRTYRRLMMHQLAVLAPLAEKVLVPVVPGNHDETIRVQKMPLSDSWAIEGASAVQDWMSGRPEYAHVEFVFPNEEEAGVTVDVGTPGHPLVMAFVHGHTTGANPNKVLDWWKGQSHGRQLAGQADILVSAHWHHLRVEATGGNRSWIQIPALDGGSDWFRRKTGDEPDSGIVSVELTPGVSPGWRSLTVHS